MAKAKAAPVPKLGISPKSILVGDVTQTITVYGVHLNQLGVRRLVPSSHSHNWSGAAPGITKNHYIEFVAGPRSSRKKPKGRYTNGDLTVTVTFTDGSVESLTCEDIEYEEPLAAKPPSTAKSKSKAVAPAKSSKTKQPTAIRKRS